MDSQANYLKKKKLLSRYLDPLNNNSKNKNKYHSINDWLKDYDDLLLPKSSSYESESYEREVKRKRVQSSDEDEGEEQVRKHLKEKNRDREEKENKKDRKIKKKLRKALGLGKYDDVYYFLNNLQIDGIDKGEILYYLSKNKNALIKVYDNVKIYEGAKKKKKKDKKKDDQYDKFKMFYKSDSSDLYIPAEARAKTIYRNKDGTIRDQSYKYYKYKRKQEVLARLAYWYKGMKKGNEYSDEDKHLNEDIRFAKDNKVWDDPMRRWEYKNPMKLLKCKYDGPPNRYNIAPGYRWDGVVRGNGFENRYLREINLKKAKKDQEYIYYMRDL